MSLAFEENHEVIKKVDDGHLMLLYATMREGDEVLINMKRYVLARRTFNTDEEYDIPSLTLTVRIPYESKTK